MTAPLEALPTVAQLTALSAGERHTFLDDRRGELYQVASVVADRTLKRAWQQRPSYPPYGLARSLFSQLRVVAADPRPYEHGSIDSFDGLGRAYLDTVVFHLERVLAALRGGDEAWLVERLDQLLALYRVDAGPTGQARIRDPFSFMYGGLHFGVSLCVQMAEVMARRLAGRGFTAGEKVEMMGRSVRCLYQVAAVNLDDIDSVYRHLHGPSATPWLEGEHFRVHTEDGRPRRIDLVAPPDGAEPHRYRTRGCPARSSPSGGPGAIATLWRGCTELALVSGLLTDD